jgi:hypothetical protein
MRFRHVIEAELFIMILKGSEIQGIIHPRPTFSMVYYGSRLLYGKSSGVDLPGLPGRLKGPIR